MAPPHGRSPSWRRWRKLSRESGAEPTCGLPREVPVKQQTGEFGVNPRGPRDVTLGRTPLTWRPPNPGDVTDAGMPLIWALAVVLSINPKMPSADSINAKPAPVARFSRCTEKSYSSLRPMAHSPLNIRTWEAARSCVPKENYFRAAWKRFVFELDS